MCDLCVCVCVRGYCNRHHTLALILADQPTNRVNQVCLRDSNIVNAGNLNKGLYMINHGEVDVLGVAIRRQSRHRRPSLDHAAANVFSRNVALDRLKDGDFFGHVEVSAVEWSGVECSAVERTSSLRFVAVFGLICWPSFRDHCVPARGCLLVRWSVDCCAVRSFVRSSHAGVRAVQRQHVQRAL